jgi:hypothetical protein
MSNPADVAGANADGSNSLAKESKVGTLVQFVVTAGVTGLLAWTANLDTSHWSGYLGMVGVAAVGLVTGLGSAYLKKNR